MDKISLYTAIIDAALVCAATGALLLILWKALSHQRALMLWGLSQLTWAAAMGLMAARGVISDALSILAANALAVTAMLLLWGGLCSFLGRRSPLLPAAVILVIYWISFPLLTYATPDIAARIVVVRLLMFAATLGALYSLWAPVPPHGPRRRLSVQRRVAASLGLAPLMLTFIISGAMMVVQWDPSAAFFGHPVIVATVLGTTVAMLTWALVFLYLVIEIRSAERQTSAEMQRFLLDQTVVAMFVAEGNRLSYVNKAFADLFGYSANKIVDEMTLESLAAPCERERLRQALERFRTGEVGETHPHYRALRANGSEFFVDGQARVLFSDDKQSQVLVGMLADTTAQHEARERARQAHEMLEQTVAERTAELQREAKTRSDAEGTAQIFRLAIEQMDAAVLLADQDHRVIHANGACQGFVQQTSGRTAHLDGQALDPTEPLQGAVITAIRTQSLPWTGEVSLKNGLTLAVTVSALRAGEGQANHVVVVASDISQRVQVNQKMAEAKLAAEQSSRAKSEFLANMSHELRTPLNAILGFSEMISNEVWGPVGNSYYRNYAQDIHGSASHLLGVINDVLDIAAVEQGSLALHEEWGTLCDVIEGSLRLVTPRAEGLTLNWQRCGQTKALEIYADLRRLKQILLNLLSNAVKFTPAGGAVGVEITCLPSGGVEVTVYDSGIGMSPEGIAAAMQRFGQVDSSLARRWEGTGLGLPLASELAEMHDATLSVSSAPGAGTRISITIPASRCRQANRLISA